MSNGLLEDLRLAARALAKNRSFTFVAVLSLALGVGANTTVFTLLNALLLRSVPVAEPDRMVAVNTLDAGNPGNLLCSYLNYKDYRDRNQVFSSLLLYSPILINLTEHGDPRTIMGQIVSGNYFQALGVNPVLGRAFLPEEDVSPGARPMAVISYGFWQRMYGGDREITGRTVKLNGRNYQIVGVAPQGFQGINSMFAAEVWVPFMMYDQIYPNPAWVNQRRALLFSVGGRLKPGIGIAQAEASLQTVARELEKEYPAENRGRRVKLTSLNEAAVPGKTRDFLRKSGVVLLIVSCLVLLIACANVANLQLSRAARRSREITVRLALGASRWQLIRQLLVESAVLATGGAVAGMVIARWTRDILWSVRPPILRRAGFNLDLDWHVFLYTLVVSLATGILFGLIPGFRATRTDLARDLKERSGQSASTGGWHPRSVLVMLQVALSLVALVGAGLFTRSLRNAGVVDAGFDAAHLAVISFNLSDQGYNEARGRIFHRMALERAAAVPGVDSVSIAKDVPFSVGSARTLVLEGQDNTQGRLTLTSVTYPGYFRSAGIGLLRGRDFNLQDTKETARVAIVNQTAAEYFWPGRDAVGQTISFYPENLPVTVIGVARNANYLSLGEAPQAMVYLSLVQYYFPYGAVYLHTRGNPDAVISAARQQLRRLDPNLVLDGEAASSTISQSLWAQRLLADLLAVFGLIALLLATIGLYGVISYSVQQRTREMGIRQALGATSADIQRMVVREGIRLVAIGVVVGTMAALAGSRAVNSLLFVAGARDAMTFILVPSILTLIAIFACWLPALRATRVDPAIALRDE
ncbi:MAG TPA: ABC transporter permease [Candidatus Sulfopaludibacter sp.]|jgi:predicted permease|nr:ABC transporter permease [Candidatus Sulfopaludibacter sp.]